MKIVILGTADERLLAAVSGINSSEIVQCGAEEILPDTDCVLLTDQTPEPEQTAALLRSRTIPAAAVTADGSDERAEFWLDCGIDRIFVLPMPETLLQKRISALAGSAVCLPDAGFELFARIAESNQQRGAYAVHEPEFFNIYRFVQRLQERMDKQAQLVIFSFQARLDDTVEPGAMEEAFQIAQKCLRRGDIVSISGQRILAIMMGADKEGGYVAASRIVNTYQAYCSGSAYDLRFEMQTI
ncbi:MAG: hypothetical protein IK130_06280 [Oscillospiraceae bacterium]|nr:hypothetical protein [Oscillospiraceae bacterium]